MDITSLLEYYTTIASTTGVTLDTSALTAAIEDGDTEEFSTLLNESIKQYSETASLVEALSGTVISGTTDLSELSNDMLRTSSGQEMMETLIEGQFASIVTSNDDDDDDEDTISSLLDETEDSTSTLESLIEQMETLADTMATSTTASES